MRRFLSQPLLITATTYMGIWYPVTLYSQTKSIFLLGLATTLYNLSNAIGSYFWGDLLDKTERRFEYGILLPVSLAISALLLGGKLEESLLGYTITGFASALNSPLYSLLLLENYSFEEIPKMNSRLSQLTLLGNAVGSISAIAVSSFLFPLLVCVASIPLTVMSLRGAHGKINIDKPSRLRSIRELTGALTSFTAFNFGAEIFFTTFVPFNYLMGNPGSYIYVSYFVLYLLDEGIYYVAGKWSPGREAFLMHLSIMGRAMLVLGISLILKLGIRSSEATIPLFVTFGSFYPLFGTSFFSFMFRNLKRNRGSIIGVFNAVEDVANIGGSATVSFLGSDLNLDYLVAFYSFALSAVTLYSFITRRLSSPSSN
ncbi:MULTISPECIES: MFS transporter [Metallosphaera]|uniref:Major facilitator superfamily MFS_1 n=4 Tax=Metallosphaera TaxID=41980 RepID=A4YIH3_METS5|nr:MULTISPECIES: MFS transporter [Metallosphaera]ABP96225.1 major facilitator superfamily MFS_1 [Metallosphaera sedula DSM 5348]AIM28208.1 major facilitator superfamily MFS_1 [Metallosphaera sedula]MCY0861117.1 MFS transporter [Metallosphaera prunae]QCO30385.1 MFS transporter [Metallosphaera prunae]WPX06049.1 MFS transporter [Metallosphaera sedula DSM 5348]